VPLCFLSHCVFYLGVFYVSLTDISENSIRMKSGRLWKPYADRTETDGQTEGGDWMTQIDGGGGGNAKADEARDRSGGSTKPEDVEFGHTWPTEKDEFEDKVKSTKKEIQDAVRWTLFLSALLFFAIFVWSIAKYWFPATKEQLSSMAKGRPMLAGAEEQLANWSSPLFRPRSLACAADGQIFLSDGLRFFQLPAGGALVPMQSCRPNGSIVDLGTDCDGNGKCWPVALVQQQAAQPPVLVDYRSCVGLSLLPQAPEGYSFQRMHLRTGQLYIANGREAVQFQKEPSGQGWQPEWLLGTVGRENITSLDSAEDNMLLFYSDSIEARKMGTLQPMGAWSLPPDATPAVGGCAIEGGKAVLVLLQMDSIGHGRGPKLMRIPLPPIRSSTPGGSGGPSL